jgi:predicted O-methyltransferase YrrM
MEFDAVAEGLAGLDYQALTSPAVGRLLYELALKPGVEDVLELGFAHGTSTAYIAAALDEKGAGGVTTIDRREALQRRPNIHDVLGTLRLGGRVTPVVAARSYTWELMRILERSTDDGGTRPCFDLCFIDGAHTWEVDGLAFLLVDRLLRPDRWIVFDDIGWSFAQSPSLHDSADVASLPEDERVAHQVRLVIDLLVRTTPGYEVLLVGNLALAFKGATRQPSGHRADFEEVLAAAPEVVRELALGALLHGIDA